MNQLRAKFSMPHPAVVCGGPQLLGIITELEAGTYPFPPDEAIWRGDLEPELAERLARATGADDEDLARCYTPARRAQGFRDQVHLDAFYRYYDHTQAGRAAGKDGCGCGTPAPGYDGPDGWQPAENICPEGNALSLASR